MAKTYWYITGSSKGLGKEIVNQLFKDPQAEIHGLARSNSTHHQNYTHHTIDLSINEAVQNFKFIQHEDAEKIILINNAGTLGEINYAGHLAQKNIVTAYQLNTITPHLLINLFIQNYQHLPCPKIIVNVTSGAAESAYDGWSIYCATKAALNRMSEAIAKEFALNNKLFHIFAIAPGVMDTSMQSEIRQTPKHQFSKLDKFLDLATQRQLYDPNKVAQKYIEMIKSAEKLEGVIHRIHL